MGTEHPPPLTHVKATLHLRERCQGTTEVQRSWWDSPMVERSWNIFCVQLRCYSGFCYCEPMPEIHNVKKEMKLRLRGVMVNFSCRIDWIYSLQGGSSWVCLRVLRGLSEEGRFILNVSRTTLWLGFLTEYEREKEKSKLSTSNYVSASWLWGQCAHLVLPPPPCIPAMKSRLSYNHEPK